MPKKKDSLTTYIIVAVLALIIFVGVKQGRFAPAEDLGQCKDGCNVTIVARGTNEEINFVCTGSTAIVQYMSSNANIKKTGAESLEVSTSTSGCGRCTSGISASASCVSDFNLNDYKSIIMKVTLSIGHSTDIQGSSSVGAGAMGKSISTSCPFGFGTGATQYPCPEYDGSFNGWVRMLQKSSGGWDMFYKECETCDWKYTSTATNLDKLSVSVDGSTRQTASTSATATMEWVALERVATAVTRLECIGGTCTEVAGAGENECSTKGQSCIVDCEDTTWAPAVNIICSGEHFTQTSNCGNIRTRTGTKDCSEPCEDITWSPELLTICEGTEFEQFSNCGNTKIIMGTKDCGYGVDIECYTDSDCPQNVCFGTICTSSGECQQRKGMPAPPECPGEEYYGQLSEWEGYPDCGYICKDKSGGSITDTLKQIPIWVWFGIFGLVLFLIFLSKIDKKNQQGGGA